MDDYAKEHHWFRHMPRAYARAYGLPTATPETIGVLTSSFSTSFLFVPERTRLPVATLPLGLFPKEKFFGKLSLANAQIL
jgi:hypothetical protein